MAKLILASVLCIFLLVKGTEAAEVATGGNCAAQADTCAATDYCEADLCKIKEQGVCDSTGTSNCIANAECPAEGNAEGKTPNKCTCEDEYTASSDKNTCVANVGVGLPCDGKTCVTTATCDTVASTKVCRLKIGETCTSTVQCVTGSECPTAGSTKGKCTCSAGATASQDKTKCGAMGIAASMLLVVATFVTSRFL